MAKTAFESFREEFFRELKQARTNPEAYDRATEKFESQHGFVACNSYETFRRRNKRDRK